MNIWLIQTGEPLPLNDSIGKLRTALLADKLAGLGHSVTWWASAFDHVKKRWYFNDDTEVNLNDRLKIIALKGTGYKKNISLMRFIDHRIVALKFKKMAQRSLRPDIILTAMPPHDIAFYAVLYAKEKNIPVIVDVRDEWPDLFVKHVSPGIRKVFRLLLAHDFYMVKKIMRNADSLVSMMSSLLDWGLKYAERSKTADDKVYYLGCSKAKMNIDNVYNLNILKEIKNRFVVTFTGTFVENNNPSILVECAKIMSEKNIHFVLAGDGELLENIKKQSAGLTNISLPGWLNQAEVIALLKHSHVGVSPTREIRDAFPNKVFSYFSAGIPVVSSFDGELRQLLEKKRIGYYFPPDDVDTLSKCILNLYEDKELYSAMTLNVKKVFDEMFDADKIYEEYAIHIEKMAAQPH